MLIYRFTPRPAHVARVVEDFLRLAAAVPQRDSDPDDEWDESVVEFSVVRLDPYENAIAVLFSEAGKYGLRLDGEGDAAWWQSNGFERIEGDDYIDPETYEQKTVDGSPARYPIPASELPAVLRAFLTVGYGLGDDTKLVATNEENPDAWPFEIPMVDAE